MNIKDIKVNKDALISVALFIAAGALAFGTFIQCRPMVKAIDEARFREAAYRKEIALVRDILKSKDMTDTLARLVAHKKVAAVMDAIKDVALKAEMPITIERPPVTAKDEGGVYRRVLYYMKSTAPLKKIGEFLVEVRKMPDGVIDLDSLRLLPDDETPGLVNVKMTFVVFAEKK